MSNNTQPHSSKSNAITVKQITKIKLGTAWSSNTINTVIFRHHGIVSSEKFQYTAFYVDSKTLRVIQRCLTTNSVSHHDILGRYNLHDAHNSISLGIDRNGHIHISYDHHSTKLKYRRTVQSHKIKKWSDELAMTGVNEANVSYPTFILPRANHPLTLLYRDGNHHCGSARFKTYDEINKSWSDSPTPILSGASHLPWTSNAYWNHPAYGKDGSIHLSFVWRTESIGEQETINNINMGYAYTLDNGKTWQSSRKQKYKLPITQVNAEVIIATPPGSNLINQTSMALDSQNQPHIVYYANNEKDIPQYQYIWLKEKNWENKTFANREIPFLLRGKGTLQIPISRPEIIIDKKDNVYAILRGDITNNKMSILALSKSKEVQANNEEFVELCRIPLGKSEPVIDRVRWERDNILTMLLQYCEQPNNDAVKEEKFSDIWLVDFTINKK